MNKLSEQPPMHAEKQHAVLLLLFFLVSYILPLGARDLLVPDETRYAEIPREMIAGGDWVVPHLDGLRYFEKPPLGYWVHAASILLLGENNFAVRLPSAMAVGLSALLIYMLICRVCSSGDKEWNGRGILSALIFLSCFEVAGIGNTAVLDSLFSFFLTATITTFYLGSEAPPGSAREKGFLLLSGVSCGLAFLTKGFLAFALPVLVLASYLVWQHRYIDLIRMSWMPILTAALVALPWSILIHLREPDFWRFIFWNEHIRRFIGDHVQHLESMWFFVLTAPGVLMPWTFMAPAAVAGIREQISNRSPQGRLIRFSICWLVLPFLFFSVSKGKLLTYILPCFPPFAILMAFGLSRTLDKGKRKAFQWGVAITGFFFGLILLALIYIQVFGYGGFRLYSHPWKSAMVLTGLAVMVVFCFWSLRSRYGKGKIVLLGLAPLLLVFLAHFTIPDLVIEASAPGRLLENHENQIGPDDVIISCEEAVGAACWNLKRDDVYVLGSAGELKYGLDYKDAAGRLLDVNSATRLIDQNRGKTVLIARIKRIIEVRNGLPLPVNQDISGPGGYVFWRY
jgi:4-amino-4-deoxy-L-arabinose transferase